MSEAFGRHWREIVLAAGTRIAEQSCFYLFSTYILTYAKDVLQVGTQHVLTAINVAAGVEFFTIPIFGILSDRLSRRGVYMVGCLFLAGFAMPYYWLLTTRSTAAIMTAVVVSLAVGHALLYSVQASLIPELFGTRLRYTGASLGYQLASPVAGGLAPLIATSLLSLACVWGLAETSRKDICTSD